MVEAKQNNNFDTNFRGKNLNNLKNLRQNCRLLSSYGQYNELTVRPKNTISNKVFQ